MLIRLERAKNCYQRTRKKLLNSVQRGGHIPRETLKDTATERLSRLRTPCMNLFHEITFRRSEEKNSTRSHLTVRSLWRIHAIH
jgi:hypothetical protein